MIIDTLFSTLAMLSIDIIGRKKAILVVQTIAVLALLGSLLLSNIWLKVGLYGIPYSIGAVISILYEILLVESSPKGSALQNYILPLSYIFWGLGIIFVNTLMLFIDGIDSAHLVNLFIFFIAVCPSFFYLKESP